MGDMTERVCQLDPGQSLPQKSSIKVKNPRLPGVLDCVACDLIYDAGSGVIAPDAVEAADVPEAFVAVAMNV